jgi:PPM family protein phosphatase
MTIPRLVRATAASYCGPTRQRNEDMAVIGGRCVRDAAAEAEWAREGATRPFLVAALDGLGGHQGGDQASAQVAERLAAAVWRWSSGCSAVELAAGLGETMTDAHRELGEVGREDTTRAGCGTTCTALLVAADAFLMVHVGDTRCYRRRDGLWKQLTQDHSVMMPDGSGQKISRLIYAVGADLPELPPDLVEDLSGKCFPGDVYLLVTDGVLAAAGSEAALEAALEAPDAKSVVDKALAHGGPDNATAVRLELVE